MNPPKNLNEATATDQPLTSRARYKNRYHTLLCAKDFHGFRFEIAYAAGQRGEVRRRRHARRQRSDGGHHGPRRAAGTAHIKWPWMTPR